MNSEARHLNRTVLASVVCAILGALLSCCLPGCGNSSSAERVAVSGEVTLDGQPLPNAQIRFQPRESPGVFSRGAVRAGKFSIPATTGPGPGAYDILILPAEPEFEETAAAVQAGKQPPVVPVNIPANYQREGALQAEIPPGGRSDLKFELISRK